MLDIVIVGDTLFEVLNDWAIIRQPATVEYLLGIFQEIIAAADIRPTDVQFLVKCRSSAIYGQVLLFFDPLHLQ
jgi:hypothetical protein